MDIPYGFDCYTFQKDEIKYFEKDAFHVKKSLTVDAPRRKLNEQQLRERLADKESLKMIIDVGRNSSLSNNRDSLVIRNKTNRSSKGTLATMDNDQLDYVKFTRKNEEYSKEQMLALGRANRLNLSEMDRRMFCGIKIQLGIGVATGFLRKGLQYKPPVKGRSELVNGSWTGVMKGLTVDRQSPISYDLAFGNFLAWDEEFPYIKFGPFFAVESKLVLLTGSSRQIEASTFGTNITGPIWLVILSLLLALSILAGLRTDWRAKKYWHVEQALESIYLKNNFNLIHREHRMKPERINEAPTSHESSILVTFQNFFFIYFTMLLNKPSLEFDELIWPRSEWSKARSRRKRKNLRTIKTGNNISIWHHIEQEPHPSLLALEKEKFEQMLKANPQLKSSYERCLEWKLKRQNVGCLIPTSIRVISYMWSAACFVIASIYSGEMLAVMLLHADTNVDTISQLINSKPPIEPVIRQDDFTYNLMLKSLDENMLKLHNKTRIIPRQEVYTRQFIESVSRRKVALLGDDELIETIYDLYHKHYALHKSKTTYLQYPISIMYRKDLDPKLETNLRRGLVQMFEMGLIHRWYQAQKDTYIQFYDFDEGKNKNQKKEEDSELSTKFEHKYKPLSIAQFVSFYKAMFGCIIFSFFVLILEILHSKLWNPNN